MEACRVASSVNSGRLFMRLPLSHAAVLVLGYVALDWASFIHAMHGLNITPWSPAPALGLAYVMRFGVGAGPYLFAGIMLADALLRELPADFVLRLLLALTVAAGYTVAGLVIRRRMTLESMFATRNELFWWMGIVILGSAMVSAAYASILVAFGVVSLPSWAGVLARYWIGDGIGIIVTMPSPIQ